VATKTLRDEYRLIKPADARVLLFDGGDAPLTRLARSCSAACSNPEAGR
jgi:NADH:ubiquinone reductase (H+-translocating)